MTAQIESYPDEFWMNVVEEVFAPYSKPTSGGVQGIAFLKGINPNWPSQRLRSENIFDGRGNCTVVHHWPKPPKIGFDSFDTMI